MRAWRLTWGDASWTAEDLTARHLVLVAEARGVDDWLFEPFRGPVRLIAVLAACIAVAEDVPLSVAAAALQTVPLSVLLSALSFEDAQETGDGDSD